jgi:Protein of unknown function (DUF2927)
MRLSSYLFIIGLILIIIGVAWILAGGTDTGTGFPAPTAPVIPPAQGTPAPSGSGAQPGIPTGPVTPAPVATATPVFQPTQQISPDEIKLHFMDLAFGSGNAYLERWNATDNNGRIVISVSANHDSDIPQLAGAAKEFNSISQTNQLSEMIKDGMNGNIAIKFIPENGMDAIALNTSDDLSNREFRNNGTLIAKVTRGIVYIDGDLRGDLRNHTLMKGLYYELGVTGNTQRYPDSLFYAGDNTNTNLTSIDRSAIAILYEPGLYHGMTADDTRKILFVH